ncbi:hypothetical protein M405DRAFT_721869, partial [Rhizopogon salebrosus TDB-379]
SSRKTHWSDAEVDVLLDFLIKNRSKLGGTTFKEATYNDAAKEIASLKIQGSVKTGAQCKNKWNSLKNIYHAIQKYSAWSGCHWDNVNGANI